MLVLLDASGFIYRAFHVQPKIVRGPEDAPEHVGAIHGFCEMLHAVKKRYRKATHFAAVFDASKRTFRNDLYADYKANRKPTDPELAGQMKYMRPAVEAFGIPVVETLNYEADDVMASYAKAMVASGGEAEIVSGDKDLMQMISPGIFMYCPLKHVPISAETVRAKFGVQPSQMIDFQALVGDAADNVPGVNSIGAKTAAALLQEYGTLDFLLRNVHKLKGKARDALMSPQQIENAHMSRDLVELRANLPLPVPIDDLVNKPIDLAGVVGFTTAMEFESLGRTIMQAELA